MIPYKKQTRFFHWLLALACSIVLVMMTPCALAKTASSHPEASPPPSVELEYVVRVKITAMSIGGQSSIKWIRDGNAYSIVSSARGNALGKVLESSSQGHLIPQGLSPDIFREKRIRKDETVTEFNHQKQSLTFPDGQTTVPLENGIQDRASAVWQLVSMARATPEKFVPGSEITLKVAGRKEIDLWHFAVLEEETLQSQIGELKVIYIRREDEKGKTTEIWLAPEKEWYPVRVIFDDNKHFRLEQTIRKITQK